jgi:hypothetical protein
MRLVNKKLAKFPERLFRTVKFVLEARSSVYIKDQREIMRLMV